MLTYLVIEVDEEQDGEDADEDEPRPVGVVDGVVGVPAQRRRRYVVLVPQDLARVVDLRLQGQNSIETFWLEFWIEKPLEF